MVADECPVDLEVWGAPDLKFDFDEAGSLASALLAAAGAIDRQAPSRGTYVKTAMQDFSGYFSDLFAHNARVAAVDGSELSFRLREAARHVNRLVSAARAENERRRSAREWKARVEARRANWIDSTWDAIFGEEPPPQTTGEAVPQFSSAPLPMGQRQHPTRGVRNGGTSSARPENLRSFASGMIDLNGALAGHPGAIESRASDFMKTCDFGSIDVAPLVRGHRTWLVANEQDVSWAETVAKAFEDAGAGAGIGSLPDSALEASLAAAGVGLAREDLIIDAATAIGAMPTTGFAMDPVNTSTGDFLEPETDVSFVQPAATLELTRMYNSLSETGGIFGQGWASTLDIELILGRENGRFVQADGRHIVFPREGAGYGRAIGENLWLAEEQGEALSGFDRVGPVLVARDNLGNWWAFTLAGQWLGLGQGPGSSVVVERDNNGSVAALRHERGRRIDIDYSGGRVAVVRVSDGRRIEYAYEDGALVAAVDMAGARSYRWNSDGLIDRVTDASGVVECENTYDATGRVVSQVTQHGRTVRFSYLAGRVTAVSDEDGQNANTWIADRKGRLVGVIDAADRRQSMSYDRHGNLVSVTERDGSVTVHAYDERGRRVRTVTEAGADVTYGYDDADRVVTVVSEVGGVTEYRYGDDGSREPVLVIDAEGGRTELAWERGVLTRAVDPNGVAVEMEHDAFGELIAVRNAAGDTALIERDSAGRPVATVTPLGHRTEFRYDVAGLLVSRSEPDGGVWRFEYGAGARLTAVTDPLGARTETEYGANGEISRTVDPLGRATVREFDKLGNIERLLLPDGAEWGFAHDALSRLREITDPGGGVWARDYDAVGNVASRMDPTGVREDSSVSVTTGVSVLSGAFDSVTTTSDSFGRPVRQETGDGAAELTVYDLCGRPVELVDANGGLTKIARDAAGQVVSVTTPEGRVTRYGYDECGRPSAAIDPAGGRTTLAYDADSRVVSRTLPAGETSRIEYDSSGRVTREEVPGVGVSRYGYDRAGRVVFCQGPQFGIRRFRYDAAGQLVAAANGVGGVTRYTYDERGRVVRITDPLGGVTLREYTQLDHVSKEVDQLGRVTTASYDAAGRQLTQTDPLGGVTQWEYDAAGDECGLLLDGQRVSRVERDTRSRTVAVTDYTADVQQPVTHTIRFDRLGHLVERNTGTETTQWEYDRDGLRTAMTTPNGDRTEYRHDAAGRVVRVEHTAFGVATFTYDASNNIVEARAGEQASEWEYSNGFVVGHATRSAAGEVRSSIGRDAEGRIVSVAGPGGLVEYGYDDAHQLVSLRTEGGDRQSWEYDAAGRLTREERGSQAWRYAYDAAGQLLSRDGAGGTTGYVYDALGRRVRERSAEETVEYSWDRRGWLTRVARSTAAHESQIELCTNALGELAEVGGEQLVWDTASPVPTVAGVGDASVMRGPAGTVGLDGSWELPGWRKARATTAGDPWRALGGDRVGGFAGGAGLGLSAAGGVTVAGLEILGARAYDPASRGFLTVDPLEPVTGAGWSGNPYAFAGNDPMHQVDPWGLRPVTDAELARYTKQTQSWFRDVGDWWHDVREYVAGTALVVVGAIAVVAGIAAVMTGVGVLPGVMLSAGGGFLLDLGGNVLSQKSGTDQVDWRRAAEDSVVSTIVGAVVGGAAGKLLGVAWKGLKPLLSKMGTSTAIPKLGTKPPAPTVPSVGVPDKAWTVLERVDAKGAPFPNYAGGRIWDNRFLQLPVKPGVTYREWDVNVQVTGKNRGTERVVTGSDGSAYWTDDHYETFLMMRGPVE